MKEQTKVSKAYSIASLITGIFGLLLWLLPYVGIVLSIVAIVFSRKKEINGMSTTGLVLGIIGVVINLIMLLLVLIALLLM